ncbi:Na(+)/H(+) antiporter subunit C [Pseudonocardia sp. H11422]|uniref:Na(+)/H(+) antiporter subunit C n=1 Tax=Pseudonocardia sp. H11422 TaxID=2835866 RepID=UPI001BDC5D29|nr:Na(+)/H(+) antiporter subunit C [Pseudonocardia sp. H11422]
MSMAVVVAVLYGVGFYLLLQRSLMRVLIGIVVLGHGANLLLQLAGGPPGRAPIVGSVPAEQITDPLPQALALTAIVITFALTTYLLALGYRSWVLVGHDEVQDDLEDRRIAQRRRPEASMGEEAASDDMSEDEDDPGSAAASGDPVESSVPSGSSAGPAGRSEGGR